jgi:hypothetical protein
MQWSIARKAQTAIVTLGYHGHQTRDREWFSCRPTMLGSTRISTALRPWHLCGRTCVHDHICQPCLERAMFHYPRKFLGPSS